MAKSPIPEVDVGGIIDKIRKELEKSRPVSGAPQEMARVASRFQPQEPGGQGFVDRLLWVYGMRYSRLINRVPLLRKIAVKQYVRIVSTSEHRQALEVNLSQTIEGVRKELNELAKQVSDHERSLLEHERRLIGLLEEARGKTGERKGIDRLLWVYGMRYSRLINRVPLLRKIAVKQYVRIVSTSEQRQALEVNLSQTIEGVRKELNELAKQVSDHERSLLERERSLIGRS